MTLDTSRKPTDVRPDPRLVQALFGALFLGVIAMLSLPAARGYSAWLGWMPLWLLGMPLVALAAACLTRTPQPTVTWTGRRRVGAGLPARRHGPAPARARLPRAA